jgi:hypothetical protein
MVPFFYGGARKLGTVVNLVPDDLFQQWLRCEALSLKIRQPDFSISSHSHAFEILKHVN